MVERQLRSRGIADERVLAAMAEIPRECFVEPSLRERAYDDGALPTAEGQTISQPWVVAAISEALGLEGGKGERTLEIGTGSGYSTAILSRLCASVITIERYSALAETARERLAGLGIANVEVRVADGSRGVPSGGPFEAIAVHAAAPAPPPSLVSQLAVGGHLVMPVAEPDVDLLSVFTLTDEGLTQRAIAPCRFVPLVGEEGFEEG